MAIDLPTYLRAICASVLGLAAGGAGIELLIPFLRAIDPLGLTPIAFVGVADGTVLGWYLRSVGPCSQTKKA